MPKFAARYSIPPGGHIMTVQMLGSGWAAVDMWLNNEHTDIPDMDFWEPWQSGIGRYPTKNEALQEAIQWAESEEMPLDAMLEQDIKESPR